MNKKVFKKIYLFFIAILFLISTTAFTNVSAKESFHNFTKAEKEEFAKAFSNDNINSALEKIDFNKSGTQTIKLSENYVLNCRIESTTNEVPISNKFLKSGIIEPASNTDPGGGGGSSYYTTTKYVYIDATALIGWKVWDLKVSGTFAYDNYSTWVIDSNCSPNTYEVGWGYTDKYVKNVQVSSIESKVVGSAKFYLGYKDIPIQSFTPVIAVGCNQYGSLMKYY